jgi:putative drug exporter of the RND superfamily
LGFGDGIGDRPSTEASQRRWYEELYYLAFVLPPERPRRCSGSALATAVLLDAVVIRSLLLPAVLELLGRWTWALPGSLGRILPRVATEPAADTTPRREVPHGR